MSSGIVNTPFRAYGPIQLKERVRTCRDHLYCPINKPCKIGCGCDRVVDHGVEHGDCGCDVPLFVN